MSKYTPEPWVVKDRDTVVGPQGNVVAECCGYSVQATDKDQVRQGGREANAALIAAAPAMYEALQWAKQYLRMPNFHPDNSYGVEEWTSDYNKLQAALAQAEGRGGTPW